MVVATNFSFYILVSVERPSSPNLAHSWLHPNAHEVRRYFCSFFCWMFPGARTGTLSWLEGTLQALYRMRKRTRRRTATSTLHTIATTAAVDSPTALSLDSMLKAMTWSVQSENRTIETVSERWAVQNPVWRAHPAILLSPLLPSTEMRCVLVFPLHICSSASVVSCTAIKRTLQKESLNYWR